MKLMKLMKLFTVLLALIASQVAFSQSAQVEGKITFFAQYFNGSVLVQLDTDNTVNPSGCANPGYYSVGYSATRELLTKAKFENKTVILFISGPSLDIGIQCHSGRPVIYGVRIP